MKIWPKTLSGNRLRPDKFEPYLRTAESCHESSITCRPTPRTGPRADAFGASILGALAGPLPHDAERYAGSPAMKRFVAVCGAVQRHVGGEDLSARWLRKAPTPQND